MIPKKIHYCWFGGNPLPDNVKAMIATWRSHCPDYEIVEWNESNFDIGKNSYCREAYATHKWAFVSDYVRLQVLYEYGGIYMDTDVEVVRSFDTLLSHEAFLCFETDSAVSIGTFGIEPHHVLVRDLLKWYDVMHYVPPEQGGIVVTNLHNVTQVLHDRYGLQLNGKQQILGQDIVVYPMEYFIAKIYQLGWICATEDTYAIHHYTASWISSQERERAQIYSRYLKSAVKGMLPFLFKYASFRTAYKQKGMYGVMNKLISYIMKHVSPRGIQN